MDSNLSSVGTLEVRDVPLHFSLVSELTTSSAAANHLPPTLLRSLAPARPLSTTGLVVQLAGYAPTDGTSSTGMAACVTSAAPRCQPFVELLDVSWLGIAVC